jgi:HlyD family secretion protein
MWPLFPPFLQFQVEVHLFMQPTLPVSTASVHFSEQDPGPTPVLKIDSGSGIDASVLREVILRKKLILVVFLVLLITVGSLVYLGQQRRKSTELYYSGTIEATEANIAFQTAGRVAAVLSDEGQRVEHDQVLAVLDRHEFIARRAQAEANLQAARQSLKQYETALELKRALLPTEVEGAEAAVKALEAQLAEVESGYRAQEVRQAQLAEEETRIAMDTARRDKVRVDALFKRGVVAEREKDAADLKYESARKAHDRAVEAYRLLREGYRNEDIDLARAKLAQGRAALKLANENLKQVDVAEREVETARARVQAAAAALQLADIQLDYTELRSPVAGYLVSRNVEPGEVVTSGQEVLSVADLSSVDLKIYVGETEIGRIKPGQPAEVKIDTFPDRTYPGRVAYISPEGEFTPKIIQTHKERVKLVYLVKISLPNPDLELKTGMPADAWFR